MSAFDPTAKVATGGTIIVTPSQRTPGRFSPGQIVAGTYRIDRIVGEGGMGTVLGATHLPTSRAVALKVLQAEVAADESSVARFWREVRAMSRLNHPNVVRIFDVGSLADDTPYMAMELLSGETLGARMQSSGPLSLDEATKYITQACEAVSSAHAIGVVHRDIKTENIFLTRAEDGAEVLKVLDFGISKTMRASVADDQQKLTKTSDVFGSPSYMSPEQLKASRDVDARADVWSLGVVFFEMLTARLPFPGQSVPEIFGAILYKEPPSLKQLRPDLPADLDAILGRALAKDRDKRFATVGELKTAIERAASGRPALDTARGAEGAATEARSPSRNRLLMVIIGILIALAALSFLVVRAFF